MKVSLLICDYTRVVKKFIKVIFEGPSVSNRKSSSPLILKMYRVVLQQSHSINVSAFILELSLVSVCIEPL